MSWIPLRILIWAVSILLCETKFVVLGDEPGLVRRCNAQDFKNS
jgi:hypothetical protein